MRARYKRSNRPVTKRSRLSTVRKAIHAEYRADLETLRGMLEEQCLISSGLRADIHTGRRITLRQHLTQWWKEGPCPQRWRIYLSRS